MRTRTTPKTDTFYAVRVFKTKFDLHHFCLVLFCFFEVLNDVLMIKDYNCYGFGQYEKDN